MSRLASSRVQAVSSYAEALAAFVVAEQSDGWLVQCVRESRYLALSAPFVGALADTLRRLSDAPVLEVCAGDGALATALQQCGLVVTPTDAQPPARTETPVEALTAAQALRRHRPRIVLGSFAPVDAGIHDQVLDTPGVRHYIVLGARLGGECGSAPLWTRPGWRRVLLEDVTRWMICRHDVWLGSDTPPLTHGEAWLFSRR